jgi:hypothetical protein
MFTVVCLATAASTASAQQESTTFRQQQRFLEEQLRPLILPDLRSPPAEQRFLCDYGAVLRTTGVWLEDHGPDAFFPFPGEFGFQGSRAAFDFDFRPWLSASFDGVHFGFIRGQLDFLQYHSGDSFRRNSDWRGPFVDIGFYRFDVDQACRLYGCGDVETWSADITLGRQFLFVGRGIAYALVADGASIDWQCGDWAGLVFGSQSIRHFDNIDRSIPGFSRSDREFFGGQIEYEAWDHHKPYAYVVVQRDRSDERPESALQEFDYDSEYYGIGVKGEALFGRGECGVGCENLAYFVEGIIERGESFGIGATNSISGPDDIRSWAIDMGLIYYPQYRTKPRVLLEYAIADGDPDRATPQNTLLGKPPGSTDDGFLGFGYVNTGVSFAPLLANLEFVRVAGACRPFEECCEWRMSDLEIGASFFAYWRPEASGGVSDVRADIPGHHSLGSEIDLFMNWRVSSDVYLLLNYGVFFPDADSFTVERSRQFLGFNLTWLF